VNKDLEDISKKIDFLTEQVLITRRKQREMEELRQDLTLVFSDVFKTAVEELEQVSEYFTYEDFIYLLKKLLRNTRTISALFDQMESARDFIKDVTPLGTSVFNTLLEQLSELEQKGYFRLLQGVVKILDSVTTSLSEEDMAQLQSGIPVLIDLLRKATQPEMMSRLQDALSAAEKTSTIPAKEIGLLKILKTLSSPEVRKTLVVGLEAAKVLSRDSVVPSAA
jgi:uncharacterized protein YjgD (DUF1641 family)